MSTLTVDDLPDHIRNLVCPISQEIMCSPVFASDGQLYEKEVFYKYLVKTKGKYKSPITRKELAVCNSKTTKGDKVSRYYINAYAVKSMLDQYFEKNPEHACLRYLAEVNIDEFNALESDIECVTYLLNHRNCFANIDDSICIGSKQRMYFKKVYSLMQRKILTTNDIEIIKKRTDYAFNSYIICGIFTFYPSSRLDKTQFCPSLDLCWRATKLLYAHPKILDSILMTVYKQNVIIFYEYCEDFFATTVKLNNPKKNNPMKVNIHALRSILKILNHDYEIIKDTDEGSFR
jgi:hypothetical protein